LRQYFIVADTGLPGKSGHDIAKTFQRCSSRWFGAPGGPRGLLSQLISALEMVFAVVGAMRGVIRRERLRGEKKHSKQGRNHHAFHKTLPLVSVT
jgi:hypothetical protein